ncbi:acetoacetate decarboxylase family protein [Methylobacterium sp. P1-11]|uniref:acetoacetate decarboxylase family protein n=1 Tax=Methylobacterium sp. P1-11 TaxID=2024616 RepID=UPI001FEEC73F|nr:acetoacetate decarboxylase family protein [Methylobacterium sp. P1-11]
MKHGIPRLALKKDTLIGTLHYDDERVAMGTMTYRHRSPEGRLDALQEGIGHLNVILKLIPDVDGTPKAAQLVGYRLRDVVMRGAWEGDTRLHLIPDVNCRVADLPVRRIRRGRLQIVDFALPQGEVLHDYLA